LLLHDNMVRFYWLWDK